jgi:Na+/melibiose symporter-like transporter
MPLSMVNLPMAVYLPAVYADADGFGLGLAFVGLVMVLSRVFDGVTDPVIGFLSDRVRTRAAPLRQPSSTFSATTNPPTRCISCR